MNIDKTIAELLFKRGIRSEEEIEEFLSDKPKKTYDPALLPDMEAGVDLILSKVKSGSKICIYGDYDADGVTSTSLMLTVLSRLMSPEEAKERLSYRIPSRFEEGYGLNMDAIKAIHDSGTDFMITVDCGSVSCAEVEYAKSLGMDVLVTDHHTITDTMADCLLINPKRPDSQYPFKELCGCGVAFKVASMIQKKAGLPKSVLTEILDLVAIGTIGDIMPLVDENRTITKFGLKVINTGSRPGLKCLVESAGLKLGEVSSENVGFVIVPHLNASGRIEDASQCVKLLTARAGDPCIQVIVDDLIHKNQERKRIQSETFKDCVNILSREIGCEEGEIPHEGNVPGFIIIKSEDAHEGIAGIVAGKIKEEYYRPSIIVTPTADGSLLKGTGRSITGVNLYELLNGYEALFEKFGGHAGACGFTMKAENFEKLKKGLNFDMAKAVIVNPDIFRRKYDVDMELTAEDLTMELADQLELMAPFGTGNPKPLFSLNNMKIRDIKHMGTEGQHIRFTARDESGSVQCVYFNAKAAETANDNDVSENDSLETPDYRILGKLDVSTWQGNRRIQFKVDKLFG